MIPVAVLASGRGSNFEAIAEAVSAGRLPARIVALVCDRPGAEVISRARAHGVPVAVVPGPKLAGLSDEARARAREEHDRAIMSAIERELAGAGGDSPALPRFLVLAGYMRLMSPWLIERFRGERGYSRIVNIHPSLLPAFPGVESYAQAWRHGAKVAGATVHLVEDAMDSGPICAQEAFPIGGCRSAEEVERLGLAVEHRLYPETLAWVLSERFDVEMDSTERRLRVCPH